MSRITPHLWYDKEAKEAAEFYVSLFPDSRVTNVTTIKDTPSGDTESVSFKLGGQDFMAISAGPFFKLNPSISFMVSFDPQQDKNAGKKLDEVWSRLADGGSVLMPLQKYDFSERYGWLQDRFGLSWQLILTNPQAPKRPLIVPSLMFVGSVAGKAEEATDFYFSVFKESQRANLTRYPAGMAPDKEGTVMFTAFRLEGQWFTAMDSAREHNFGFNEAVSFMVSCRNQAEVDYYWEKLSAVPEAEQCGWCKDKYGVSWQITPSIMNEMIAKGTREQVDRVTQAFLPMKKLDIAALQKAYSGK